MLGLATVNGAEPARCKALPIHSPDYMALFMLGQGLSMAGQDGIDSLAPVRWMGLRTTPEPVEITHQPASV
jgi:hypothetical protein